MIKESDKSHKFCVNSVENYSKQGADHIGKDKIVTRKQVQQMEKKLNRNTKCLLGFLRAGESLGKNNVL